MPPDIPLFRSDPANAAATASLAVVGNAPGTGAAAVIDAAEYVVRFNNAAGFGAATGSRVTHLALVNRGGQMREWLEDRHFLKRPVVRAAQAFILPFPMLPDEHNRPEPICWTREALALLRPTGRPVHILPETLHERARDLLAPSIGVPEPEHRLPRDAGAPARALARGRPDPGLRLRLRRLARPPLGGRARVVR